MDPARRRVDAMRLVATAGGFSLVAAGLAGFDWRISAITCGALLLAATVVDAVARGNKS